MNKIYSVHYDRPDLIDLQYLSIKNHLKNDFEFIIINNAKDHKLKLDINSMAKSIGAQIFCGNGTSGLAGEHHQQALNNCWKSKCIYDNDYVWILDGDVFLLQDIEINNFMKDHVIAGARQNRKPNYNYLTPCVVIFDMKNLPEPELVSWSGCCINGVGLDTGGETYFYLEKYKNIKNNSKDLKSSWHIKKENNNLHCIPDELINLYNDEYCIEFFGNEFVHYRASSNWNHKPSEHHKLKTEFIKKMIYGSIDNSITIKNHNFQINEPNYFGWNHE